MSQGFFVSEIQKISHVFISAGKLNLNYASQISIRYLET